jgi:hypothetical protein
MAMYNPVTDAFTYFTSIETPKIEIDNPVKGLIDISDWASGISNTGIPIAKPNIPEVQQYNDYNDVLERMAKTHSEPEQEEYNVEPIVTTTNSIRTTKQNLKGNQKIAMNFFKSKGLNDYQAAGIVGNLMAESNLNYTAVNPSSKAYGIAQWLGDRKKKLFARYGKNPTFE